MKLLLNTLLFIPFLTFSQSLDVSNEPAIGEAATLYVCDSNTTDYESITGTGVNWDYSTISSVNSLTNDISITDATLSTNAGSFPTSVKALNIASSISMFFNSGTGGMSERVSQGFVFSDPGAGDFVVSFSNDDQKLMTYPFVVGDVITDIFDGSLETALLPTGPVPANGAGVATVDGQGTLVLPLNTYNNVIRYKLKDSVLATIPLVGVAQLNRTLYEYYDHSVSNLPIFVHLTTSLVSSAFNVSSTIVLSKEMPQIFTGLHSMNTVDVSVYPNPSSNKLSISNFNATSYQITNSLGQKVASGLVENSKLDISKLDAGSYFVHLVSDKITVVKSFIKK
tara:strand:- start:37 stop:1053 length:1017 start_codon:yes stop_codon:yes gene_type:complete